MCTCYQGCPRHSRSPHRRPTKSCRLVQSKAPGSGSSECTRQQRRRRRRRSRPRRQRPRQQCAATCLAPPRHACNSGLRHLVACKCSWCFPTRCSSHNHSEGRALCGRYCRRKKPASKYFRRCAGTPTQKPSHSVQRLCKQAPPALQTGRRQSPMLSAPWYSPSDVTLTPMRRQWRAYRRRRQQGLPRLCPPSRSACTTGKGRTAIAATGTMPYKARATLKPRCLKKR